MIESEIRTLPTLGNLGEEQQKVFLEIVKSKHSLKGNALACFFTSLSLVGFALLPFQLTRKTDAGYIPQKDIQQTINTIFKTNPKCYQKIADNRKPDITALKAQVFKDETLRAISICINDKKETAKYLDDIDTLQKSTAFSLNDFLKTTFIWVASTSGFVLSFYICLNSVYKLNKNKKSIKTNFTKLVINGAEPVEVNFLLKELDKIALQSPP